MLGRITCRVCGEVLERLGTPPVSCLSCETSYHVDCWAYNGSRCAVYGCDGRRAIAGLPRRGSAPIVQIPCPRLLWRRAIGPLLASLAASVVLALLIGAAFLIPWGGLYVGIVAAHMARLMANALNWLRSVEVNDEGIRFDYFAAGSRSVRWRDVARGPGLGDWSGALQLRTGEIVLMPAGEPGFDEVLKRTAVALSRRDLDSGPIFIGEDA